MSNYYKQRALQKIYRVNVQKPFISSSIVHGGVNFEQSKNIHFTYNALAPAGPIDKTGGRFEDRDWETIDELINGF